MATQWTIAVEHLDPELGPWSALEYKAIAEESMEAHISFTLTGVDRNQK